MVKKSAWEDCVYSYSGLDVLDYALFDENDNKIYEGRAYKRPGDSVINIDLSPIIRNFLNSALPDNVMGSRGEQTSHNANAIVVGNYNLPDAIHTFTLKDGKGNTLETYRFLNCYDYDTMYSTLDNSVNSVPLNGEVNNHRANGMYSFYSVLTKANNVRVNIGSGSTVNACGVAALYYSSAKGGWNAFLIEGQIKRKDTYTKYNIDRPFAVNTLDFGHKTLNNTISESWNITTHYLTDEESKAMVRNIYGSNDVYLHIFEDDRIVPVVITDTSIEEKTYKNEGRKMFQHTINVKSSQDKMRI